MNIDFNQLEKYREGNRLEAKEAQGGLPGSLQETYSSFANTNGGVILLGVVEQPDKTLKAVGLPDPELLVKQFWDNINNPQKVNVNILSDKDVAILDIDGVRIIKINIPRADRHDRPVYVGPEPFKGSYRRNGEGDYHCHADEVRNMYRDQSNESMDKRVLEKMDVNDLDKETINRYRTRFKNEKGDHVWAEVPDEEFLKVIGAINKGEDGVLHPTVAGLLMFSQDWRITNEFPHYFLDYQENDGTNERWTDRFISSSGDWSGNLYDFFFRVATRLAQEVKVPFKLNGESIRVDNTPVHDALREVLANALVLTTMVESEKLKPQSIA